MNRDVKLEIETPIQLKDVISKVLNVSEILGYNNIQTSRITTGFSEILKTG